MFTPDQLLNKTIVTDQTLNFVMTFRSQIALLINGRIEGEPSASVIHLKMKKPDGAIYLFSG